MDFLGKQGRKSFFRGTAQSLDQTAQNILAEQAPSSSASPTGNSPQKKAVWAEYQKTKEFYLQWRAAPRKGESLQAAWPKSMLWTHARPEVTEPCRAQEGQKPLTHQPCPARRCSFAAPSLGVDLCLLSKLIMRE